LNVNAADGDSVRLMFLGNRDALAATLRQLHRDGALSGRASLTRLSYVSSQSPWLKNYSATRTL